MKARTCLLLACMIIVPGLAMFSHHLPQDVRLAARSSLWEPVVAWLELKGSEPALVDPPEQASQIAVVAPPPVAPPESLATTESEMASVASPVVERLVALGAVSIECRPLEGVTGMHVASCRVAMDAAGQLHRVFQAPGPGPGEAIAQLADQVERWRDRLADRGPWLRTGLHSGPGTL